MRKIRASWKLLSFLLLAATTLTADVLIANAGSQTIFRFDQVSGAYLNQSDALFGYPTALSFGPDGYLYAAITDSSTLSTSQIQRFDPATEKLLFSFGALPQTRGMTIGPDGLIYVSAFNVNQIWRYNPTTGALIDVFVANVVGGCTYCGVGPEHMIFGPDGNLYVSVPGADSVGKYSGTTGAFISQFIAEPGLAPGAIVFGADGNLYVGSSTSYPHQVRRYIGSTGAFDKVFATSANLNIASSLAFGPDGKLYVGSSLTASVLRFDGSTGAFIDIFIPPGSQGMGVNLTAILFTGSAPMSGTIRVSTNSPAASFTITGPATYAGNGTSFTQSNATAGSYTITYGAVVGYLAPPSQTFSLNAGGTITLIGSYVSSASLGTGITTQNGSIAEPVNTATGNYYTWHVDLQVPGRGLAFSLARYYNSSDPYSGPLGSGWTHSYNIYLRQAGSLVVVKEADGHEDVFSPAGGGNYSAQTPGLFESLKSNVDGSLTLTRKNQTRLNFSSTGKLMTIVDRNGNTQTFAYAGGNLTTITDSSGRLFNFSYDGNGRVVSLSAPLGKTFHYGYDSNGNLNFFQDALGGTTQYTYDANHGMTSATDPRGNVYLQNVYDAQGRVISQSNALGFTTTFAYNSPSAGITTVVDPQSNVIQHVHDNSLRLVQVIAALGGITSYTYSPNNLKLSTTDALGRTQIFAYDARGNLAIARDPTGKATQFLYDTKNNLTQITDRLGRITGFNYDSNGNLISALDSAGNTSSFAYDLAGEVITVKNARNFTTGLTYDAAGNLTRVTDALGGTVQMTYDAAGRLLSVRNQLGKTGTRSYDLNNRLLTIADPLGNTTRFAYDPNSNLTQITDANNRITRYSYDPTNKLTQVTDAIGGVTRYAYNGNTDLTSVIDANNHTTAYAYDALRRLASSTDPLGRQKHYSYDAVGNIASTLDGNFKINNFAYDNLNRLTSMSLSDGQIVSYGYDAVGNRLTMNDWRGSSSYVYDALNRALSVAAPEGKTVGYQYDAVGNRVKLTYPDGKTVQYAFDSLNRLTKTTDWAGKASSYTYNAASYLTKMEHPNRAASIYTYDPANRLIAVVNVAGLFPISGFGYQLDKVGNRTAVISSAGGIDIFGYDGLYRLTSWAEPIGRVTRYSYDAVGNRISVTAPGGATNYAYDAADQLLKAGTTTFTYDGNGSQLTRTSGGGTVAYGWDALNRLISVTGASLNTQYQYDGDGNRVKQQIGPNAYQYFNDTATALPVALNENGPDGNISYVYGRSLISATSAAFQSFYQFDGLGSVANVTNQAGTLSANYAYDPWGQAATPVAPPFSLDTLGTKNKYRFTGEAADPNNGLLFLRTRYYDASLGRFIARDQIGPRLALPLDNNRYQYVLSNPARFVDPSGLRWSHAFAGFFGLAGQSSANPTQSNVDSCMENFDSCDLDNLAQQKQATELQALQNAQLAGSGSAELIYSGGNIGLSGAGAGAFSTVGSASDLAKIASIPSTLFNAVQISSAGGDATGSDLCIVNPYACGGGGAILSGPKVAPGSTSSVGK